jgi:hypothetical protein
MDILKYSVLPADSTNNCCVVANISQIGVFRISLLVTNHQKIADLVCRNREEVQDCRTTTTPNRERRNQQTLFISTKFIGSLAFTKLL